jgi:outer membrane protein
MQVARGALVLVILLGLAGVAVARELSLEEALRRGEENARSLARRQAESEQAANLHRSALAQYGPKVLATGQYQHWDQTLRLRSVDDQGVVTRGDVVRDQDTYSVGVSVIQPLTELIGVYLSTRLTSLGVDSAGDQRERERGVTRHKVVAAYWGIQANRKTVESLEAMHKTVESHLEKVKEFLKFGMVKRDDQLRTEVQLTSVKRSLTQANLGLGVANAQLALLVGDPLGTVYDLPETAPPQPPSATPEACEEEALRQRRDLQSARAAVEQARVKRSLRYMDWVPQLSAGFNYSRYSSTALTDSGAWYVGLNLNWSIWEWGRSYYELQAAGSDVLRWEQTLREVEDGVRLEVRTAWLAAHKAWEDIDTAQESVLRARENLSIQMTRFDEKLNTTTELINAEGLLVQAEADHARAESEYRVALEALETALGR